MDASKAFDRVNHWTLFNPRGDHDNFHGVHRLELYIVAFLKNHCIANTGPKNINKIPLCC